MIRDCAALGQRGLLVRPPALIISILLRIRCVMAPAQISSSGLPHQSPTRKIRNSRIAPRPLPLLSRPFLAGLTAPLPVFSGLESHLSGVLDADEPNQTYKTLTWMETSPFRECTSQAPRG